MCNEKLGRFELEDTKWRVLYWEIKKAPSQSEILWDNLNKGGM